VKVKDTFTIIGAGKVGTAVGHLLRNAGYKIAAISDINPAALQQAVDYTGGEIITDCAEAASRASCIIITVSDDIIASIAVKIAEAGAVKSGMRVIHMSGAGGLDLLESVSLKGACVGSIHPIQSFADIDRAIKNIPNSVFGVTCQEEIREWAFDIVKKIGGIPIVISEKDKPLYHAAACIASNYLTTLMHIAKEIYCTLGLDEEKALKAFWPLVKGTINNIESNGTIDALTGPIARGDSGTITKHLSALNEKRPDYIEVYCALGKIAIDIGLKKGALDEKQADVIRNILIQE
jgi:predicted short-subunit dehydrogenase-like oxidoreductase (DUF2520 family)